MRTKPVPHGGSTSTCATKEISQHLSQAKLEVDTILLSGRRDPWWYSQFRSFLKLLIKIPLPLSFVLPDLPSAFIPYRLCVIVIKSYAVQLLAILR
jgi:hypothetical protein